MTRLLTAFGLLAVAFYLIFLASPAFFLGAAIVTGCLCFREYLALVPAVRMTAVGWLGALLGVFLILAPQSPQTFASILPAIMIAVILLFVAAVRSSLLNEILPAVAGTLLGAMYCFLPWRFAVDLRAGSVHLLFFALALNWASDSAAFYVGRKLGKHPLAPVVSPKKSWEGAIASVAGSALFGVLYLGHFYPLLPWYKVLAMAVLGNVAGQFGDLAESALKRSAGVKDSGTLLPGHGGVLDRLDSSLFALPVILLILRVSTIK